ncbi:hypothetical protein BKA70DRAFT_1433920 [Coprinopsis sp. MPI-PUGE-AT-0042]|nr:hypothetical protein BKA70DRAFT_1433920 [Coprinopsis sp. MPI-PUGE-AT-0042]
MAMNNILNPGGRVMAGHSGATYVPIDPQLPAHWTEIRPVATELVNPNYANLWSAFTELKVDHTEVSSQLGATRTLNQQNLEIIESLRTALKDGQHTPPKLNVPPNTNPLLAVAHILMNLEPDALRPDFTKPPPPKLNTPHFFDSQASWNTWYTDEKDKRNKVSPFSYLTDEDGNYVGDAMVEAVSQPFKRLCFHLFGVYLDPKSFGQIGDMAWAYIRSRMYHLYPWLAYCLHDWKLHAFATAKYPELTRKDGPFNNGKATRNPLIPVPLGGLPGASVVPPQSLKRKSDPGDAEDQAPSKRAKVESSEAGEKKKKKK